MREKAVIVTVNFDSIRRDFELSDLAAELEELSNSAGLAIVKSLMVRQKNPNAALLIGSGKAQELADLVKKEKANVVVFESNLSSTQQRNLEEIIQVKTIDRTQL
ncbi:MAG: GTPase HflX, partial [Candidatus Omnitrophica bacterium CG07_land_8_20_14_0_80_50_8]